MIEIGPLTCIGIKTPPAKLLKALAVVTSIHDEFAKLPWVRHRDVSKESCVLCALTVRDFLQRVGFKTACVQSVTAIIRATRDGDLLHSLGVGTPLDTKVLPGKWAGHLVTAVDGFLIDTTMTPWKRPQWPELPDMIAMELFEESPAPRPPLPDGQLYPVAGSLYTEDDGTEIELVYLDRSSNQSWKNGGGDNEKSRRRAVTDALVKRFGAWRP